MKRNTVYLLFGILIGSASAHAAPILPGSLPVFGDSRYPAQEDKQEQFINYLYRLIERENSRILSDRAVILAYNDSISINGDLSDNNRRKLDRLAVIYDVKSNSDPLVVINDLKSRVLPVPPSLILAHALVEDKWNPLSTEASINIFSIPCLPRDCSDVSIENPIKMTYQNINHVVKDYIYNINTNSLFQNFRNKRVDDFNSGLALNGEVYLGYWAPLLTKSNLDELSSFIKTHNLTQYDSWH